MTYSVVWFKRDLRLHNHEPHGHFLRQWVSAMRRSTALAAKPADPLQQTFDI